MAYFWSASPSSPTSKNPLKEKLILYYDAIFKGNDLTGDNPNFWHEFFLLKVNVPYFENEVDSLSPEELIKIKDNINQLFCKSCQALREDYQIKVVNALQTLCALIKSIFGKKFSDFGFDIINVLVGFDEAELQMQGMVERLNSFLLGDYSVSLKNLTLKLLLVIATAVDNVSQNTMLEYLMMNSVFETIVQLLGNPIYCDAHGNEAILLLTILVNYRKHEGSNPYLIKLSILDDELALNGLGVVLSNILSNHNRKFAARKAQEDPAAAGIIQSITSLVGNMFVGPDPSDVHLSSGNDAILLALYEAVHLNRNFFTVLSHVIPHEKVDSGSAPSSPVVERIAPIANSGSSVDVAVENGQSTNLLVTFLSFSSVAFQDIKTDHGTKTARLCLVILICITEDQYSNAFLHDTNMTFSVPLYKMNLYHRKSVLEEPSSRPLACALLDLMVEFIVTHMMKNFPLDLYKRCIGIVHRALCYQKRCRIRLQYSWKDLWTSLMNLLKFLLSNETHLVAKCNIFDLALGVVNIFNLFITYGDTFLPSPISYDELYYEVIRVHQIFDNLYSMALRYSTSDSEYKSTASRLANGLVNVRAIINHFTPKLDSWSATNHVSSFSEEQVLDVIRCNYDTLTLKLMESLDTYEKYAEMPKEHAFFTQLIRSITHRVRNSIALTNLEQLSVLQEFSTIT